MATVKSRFGFPHNCLLLSYVHIYLHATRNDETHFTMKMTHCQLSKYQKHIRVLYSRFIGVSDHVEFLFNHRPFDKGKLVY